MFLFNRKPQHRLLLNKTDQTTYKTPVLIRNTGVFYIFTSLKGEFTK